MTVDQWKKIPLEGLDTWTLAEIRGYVERKIDDHRKIRGQIAKDLRRLGEMAFLDPSAYDQLKAKYKASRRLSRKKLAILETSRTRARVNQCTSANSKRPHFTAGEKFKAAVKK